MKPLVSVIIPCYNAEKWVAEAIQSALDQAWPNSEVIVIDDGSTDGSLAVIKSFGDRIIWQTGTNRGGNAARNSGLEMCHGEWLQYLDADDYLLPEKISKQVEFIMANPKADIVYSPVILEHWSESNPWQELLPIPELQDPWELLARWYLPQTGAPLWRKQAIVDVGAWKQGQSCCQEHELYLRLLMADKAFAYCASNGAVYRQWSEHTVCKRDKPELHRRRLEIEQRMEEFLRERGKLTSARLRAINQARFEIARMVWQFDPKFAAEVVETIKFSQPDFMPAGNSAPSHYRAIYRMLGFHTAEIVAAFKRKWVVRNNCARSKQI